MKFDFEVFGRNIREAGSYIRKNKLLDMKCRFRMETNKKNENVKIYVIKSSKIVNIARFENGCLLEEEG